MSGWLMGIVAVMVFLVFVLAAMGASCCLLGRCCRRQRLRRGDWSDEDQSQH